MQGADLDDILTQWRRERPDLDSACMAVCGEVWRAGRRLSDGLKTNLDRHGLDFQAMDVLLTLRRQGRGRSLSASEMAADMMVSGAATTARLDRLEAGGLIRRSRDRADRRGVRIELTDKGFELADTVVVGHVAAEEAMLASLSRGERAQLRGLLARIAARPRPDDG